MASDTGHLSNWLGTASGALANNDVNAAGWAPTNWEVAGVGDFNGDGRDDVLWRDESGLTINWLGEADGGFADNYANSVVNIPTNCSHAAVGDFNGDGRDDVLWREANGLTIDWLGEADGGFADNYVDSIVNIPTNWQIEGVGDFNGDGRDDILWRNENGLVVKRSDTGHLSNWLGTATGGLANNDGNAADWASTDWNIAAVGDINGDGRDDIVWRSDAGHVSNWLGTATGGWQRNDANGSSWAPTDWHVIGTGDFNGDDRDDILWRSDSGALSNWLGTASGGWIYNDANASHGPDELAHRFHRRLQRRWARRHPVAQRHRPLSVNWLGQADGGFADNYANSVTSIPTTWHVQAPELL